MHGVHSATLRWPYTSIGNILHATWLHTTIPCRTRQHFARASQGCHWQFSGFTMAVADVVGVCAAVIAITDGGNEGKGLCGIKSGWSAWSLAYEHLLQELDVSSYRNSVRMDAATFEELLGMVAP